MVTGCVSSRFVPDCQGEGECGFHGLPHVLCVPVPAYARTADRPDGAGPETGIADAVSTPLGHAPDLHADS